MEQAFFANQTTLQCPVNIYQTNYFKYFLHVCGEISSGRVNSLVTVQSCASTRVTMSLLRHSGISHLPIIPTTCSLAHCSLGTPCGEQKACTNVRVVIQTVISYDRWREMVVFHDGCADDWFDGLINGIQRANVTISLHKVTNKHDVNSALLAVYRAIGQPPPNLIIANANLTNEILKQAIRYNMRSVKYRWLLYNCDGEAADDQLDSVERNDNIAIITKTVDVNRRMHGKIVASLWSINETNDILPSEIGLNMPSTHARCSSPYSSSYRQNFTRLLSNLLRRFEADDTDVYSEYDISSVYKGDRSVPYLGMVGQWKSSGSFDVIDDLFPNKLNDFRNRTFVVASLEYSFFQRKVSLPDGTFRWEGLTFDLLNQLAEVLNFSYTVVEPPDGLWGIQDENGTWNGMIRMVQNKEVDFAAACFSITAARRTVVEFMSPYYHEQSVVVIRRPPVNNRVLMYMHPLHYEVWIAVLAAVLLCGPMLWLFTYSSPEYWHGGRYVTNADGLLDVWNATWYIFGALFQQGGSWLPTALSGRILVACFWFFSIAITATYTGNLIAFLAVTTVQMPFNTLDELVQQNKFQWGTAEGVALVMLFKQSTFEPYMSIHKDISLSPTYGVALDRVRKGNYAFIAEKAWYVDKAAEYCDLAMLKEQFYPTSYAFALQQGAPYANIFSESTNKLRESGLLAHWSHRRMSSNKRCTGLGPVSEARIATLRDFQGSIYLLLAGIAISGAILLSEIVYYRYVRPRYNKDENMAVLLGSFVRKTLDAIN